MSRRTSHFFTKRHSFNQTTLFQKILNPWNKFLNINLSLMKPFLITKFDCIWGFLPKKLTFYSEILNDLKNSLVLYQALQLNNFLYHNFCWNMLKGWMILSDWGICAWFGNKYGQLIATHSFTNYNLRILDLSKMMKLYSLGDS